MFIQKSLSDNTEQNALTCCFCMDLVLEFLMLVHQRGDETVSLNSIHLQDGWEWIDDWQIDLTRAVDEEGMHVCLF